MSNLSELLPTGGGQNAVDFVASGTLSSGQTVVLKADGTVAAVDATSGGPLVGTKSVFENANSFEMKCTYDTTNDKVVIAYLDGGNNNYGTAIVGTISGSTISFGSPTVFSSAYSPSASPVYDTANNKVAIGYRDDGDSGYYRAIVGTVSGTSISFGSSVRFDTAVSSTTMGAAYDSANGKVVFAYQDFYNNQKGKAIVGTVSGTSISFGSSVFFFSGTDGVDNIDATYDSTNGKVIIVYTRLASRGKAKVGTVSGTSISFGPEAEYVNGQPTYNKVSYNTSENKCVICYRDSNASGYGKAVVATVSGTSISFGTTTIFRSAEVTWVTQTYDPVSNTAVIGWRDISDSNHGKVISGTISGTSISFGSISVFNSTFTDRVSSTYDSDTNQVVFIFQDIGNSAYGTAVTFTGASSNSADFIGITAEAISDTATGSVNVYGGINEAYTGLTIGSDYYVQNDGSISTSVSSVIAGKAISSTAINMVDYGYRVPVEYLIVAGGGGGGGRDINGGGGGGGFLLGSTALFGTYNVTVGDGGAGGTDGTIKNGLQGGNSSIGNIVAIGGGGGRSYANDYDGAGGSGGGGAGVNRLTGGSGTAGQGNDGGDGATSATSDYGGGGGGGAGQVGFAGNAGKDGGDGLQSSISGTATYYAGGGGGAGHRSTGSGELGSGGLGGGGNAGTDADASTRAGTPNTGGGGGASRNTGLSGGNGGSGIVMIKVPAPAKAATGATVSSVGGYTIYTFTSSGSITF